MARVASAGWMVLLPMLLLWGAVSQAEQSKCLAEKTACVSKKAVGLLKCGQLAMTPGKPADANAKGCLDDVRARFDGGGDSATGCFAELERKTPNDCVTFDDTAALEAVVEGCVDGLLMALDPPPAVQSRCAADKTGCVGKTVARLFRCAKLASTPGKAPDPNAKGCADEAKAKLDGGVDPARGCFAKHEARRTNDCVTLDDAAAVEALVDACVSQVVAALTATTTPTTSTTSTTVPAGVCGNGIIEPGDPQTGGEQCDGQPICGGDCLVQAGASCDVGGGYCFGGVYALGFDVYWYVSKPCYIIGGSSRPGRCVAGDPTSCLPPPEGVQLPPFFVCGTIVDAPLPETTLCCQQGATCTQQTVASDSQALAFPCNTPPFGTELLVVGTCGADGTCVPAS